jgi:hypothetical protein
MFAIGIIALKAVTSNLEPAPLALDAMQLADIHKFLHCAYGIHDRSFLWQLSEPLDAATMRYAYQSFNAPVDLFTSHIIAP